MTIYHQYIPPHTHTYATTRKLSRQWCESCETHRLSLHVIDIFHRGLPPLQGVLSPCRVQIPPCPGVDGSPFVQGIGTGLWIDRSIAWPPPLELPARARAWRSTIHSARQSPKEARGLVRHVGRWKGTRESWLSVFILTLRPACLQSPSKAFFGGRKNQVFLQRVLSDWTELDLHLRHLADAFIQSHLQ